MKKQGRRSHARAHMWQGEKRAVLLPAYRGYWNDFFKSEGGNIVIPPKTDGQYLWSGWETYKQLEEPAILFDGKIMYIDHPYVVTTTPVIHKFEDTTLGARFPHVYITKRPPHYDNTNETLYHPLNGDLRYCDQGNRYSNGQYRSESPLYEVSREELDKEFDIKFDEDLDRRTLRNVTDFLFSKIPNGEEGGEEGGLESVPIFAAGLTRIKQTRQTYWPPNCSQR